MKSLSDVLDKLREIIDLEIEAREHLLHQMGGTLYPGIIYDEIVILRALKTHL